MYALPRSPGSTPNPAGNCLFGSPINLHSTLRLGVALPFTALFWGFRPKERREIESCTYKYIYIYIYKRGTGWQAGENYDTVPNWTSLSPTGRRPCRTPLVTVWPGLPQVGAQCGVSTVVSFKREAVCHPFRGAPVLWQNLSKTTFFGNLGWYAASTLRIGVRDGHGDCLSWTHTPPLVRLITMDRPHFVTHGA